MATALAHVWFAGEQDEALKGQLAAATGVVSLHPSFWDGVRWNDVMVFVAEFDTAAEAEALRTRTFTKAGERKVFGLSAGRLYGLLIGLEDEKLLELRAVLRALLQAAMRV